MRALVVVLVVFATPALAQPGDEPQPPGPTGEPQPPAVVDTTPNIIVDAQPEQPARTGRVHYAYGPLDDDGWPRSFSIEDLRGLPECSPEGLPNIGGAPITCRPPLRRYSPAWSIGFDLTTGATFGDVPTAGGAHGWGVDTHFALSRNFQLGARYEMLGISVPRAPGEGSHAEMAQHVLASGKLRLWTDEVGRNAWTLGGGVGLAIRSDTLGGVSPLVRASIAREVGLFYKRHASLAAVELAYEHTLEDPGLRAILASLRFGAEVNVIAPRNLDTRATPSRHVTHLHMLLSAWWGLGMSVAVPLVGPLAWETTGDFLTNVTKKHPVFRSYDGAQWSARTGLSLHTGILYALGQGGISWYAQDPAGRLDRVVHGEVGFEVNLLRMGAWLRWNLDDTFDSAGLVLSFVFGGGRWGARGQDLHLTRPWVPVYTGPRNVGVDVNTNVGVDVNVDVKVEPVVIEVPLGASVFGVGVHIDPRVLPIDKLQRAGFVQIELSGPASELSSFQAQLSGTLDSRGVRVDGWTTVETGAHIVRARFTIWPPGTRPPQ